VGGLEGLDVGHRIILNRKFPSGTLLTVVVGVFVFFVAVVAVLPPL
jgi:hypothetical protein